MAMSMEQIHRIKELQMQQKGPYQIAKELGIDPKTVRKYMEQEDFSPAAPTPEIRLSKLDPYKATIHAWLEEDKQNRRKQRHTGKRVLSPVPACVPSAGRVCKARWIKSIPRDMSFILDGHLGKHFHADIHKGGFDRTCLSLTYRRT